MDRKEARRKAQELVMKMTIEEKASQLRYDSPGISRLGIPEYNWWNEGLHGVARAGIATVFPQAIGMAASFDEDMVRKIGDIIAEEGRAKYNAASKQDDRDIYKGLTFWAPNVNIFRDPRWGRGHETYGEDPCLTATLGKAYVEGLQGNGETMKAAACAKHFAVHSGPEALRHEFNAEVSQKDMEETSLIPQILEKDVLLSYPFESMKSFINLLYEAAEDESVVSIKMTLYRLANKSQIVDALVEAAENGKEVVVLVELRARFDEENNIEYSRKLEEAGCRVIYGLNGYKVHSKLCLISRKTEQGVSYVTQIGTGNYNEKTSALYTDLSLITGNQEIGKEAAEVFAALLRGETVEETHLLLVAPKCLQNKVLDMIEEEIQHVKNGEEGYIGIKINSLTDKVIISKLVEASQAGVKIEMIVRGICCLIPGVKGYTENITVISIVGRFLEHSRIYRFGTKERENVYIASADFMTRNTLRRVEVAAPVLDERLKNQLDWMFETMMKDDEKGKCLTEKGIYVDRNLHVQKLNSQECFYEAAYANAEKRQK